MIYLKFFETHSDYQTYINGSDKILPNVSYCEDANDVHYNPWTYAETYFTTIARENGTISFNIWKSMNTDMITSISYSTDNGETWTTTANQDNKSEHLVIDVDVNTGDKVLWKGIATQTGYHDLIDCGDWVGSFFSSDCEFDAKGNVMSLLYGDNYKGQTILEENCAICCLFYDYNGQKTCGIVNAKDLSLPATTLTDNCYQYMFYDCTGLTTAPELPATTLATSCYYRMFYGCTSLVTAPELPATTLATSCYYGMFSYCTSLVTAPELPATTLEDDCYSEMFTDCTSLVTAPELLSTTLAEGCYTRMFIGCTSLVNAPELPATTLAVYCYSNMFRNCTALVNAPELPATTLEDDCYYNMFYDCTSLNYIKAMFTTTPSTDYTQNWVQNVSATGTFVKNSAAQWNVSGVHGIPSGWTVQTASE